MTQVKVTAIDFTGCGRPDPARFAAAKLAFTKSTRLNMSPDGIAKFMLMPYDDLMKELDYMAGTIPSSWEFVDVTFIFEHVSRAAAQQITRTRFTPMDSDIFGSWAMQSQRVTDMSTVDWCNPISDAGGDEDLAGAFDHHVNSALLAYQDMIASGAQLQDARGLLPMNVHCNLVAKYTLRQIVDLVLGRKNAARVQGEYYDLVCKMEASVIAIYPWAEKFFEPKSDKAINMIESVMEGMVGGMGNADRMKLAKAIDLIKKG